jgi:Polyglycine hydrolase-like, structural repeat
VRCESLQKILASHALIHTTEGEFVRKAVREVCEHCRIPVVGIRERELGEPANATFGKAAARVRQHISNLGKTVGAPWTQDEKDGCARGIDRIRKTDQARQNGWLPVALAVYGVGVDLRYAGIWDANPDGICWATDGLADSSADYHARFDALVPAWSSPVLVSVSPDGQYASIFRDTLFDSWVARHNLTSSGYQNEFDTQVAQGRMPVMVQAGGAAATAGLQPYSLARTISRT